MSRWTSGYPEEIFTIKVIALTILCVATEKCTRVILEAYQIDPLMSKSLPSIAPLLVGGIFVRVMFAPSHVSYLTIVNVVAHAPPLTQINSFTDLVISEPFLDQRAGG